MYELCPACRLLLMPGERLILKDENGQVKCRHWRVLDNPEPTLPGVCMAWGPSAPKPRDPRDDGDA